VFTLLIIGISVAVVIFLGWNLSARFASGRIERFMERRRASSRIVSRGELIDGSRHLPVALALGASALYYESSDLQASLDLEWIGDVDYDDDVVTGHSFGEGKILTIRCYSQSFRFLIPIAAIPQWQAVLPAHRQAAHKSGAAAGDPDVSSSERNRADDDGWPTQPVPERAAS